MVGNSHFPDSVLEVPGLVSLDLHGPKFPVLFILQNPQEKWEITANSQDRAFHLHRAMLRLGQHSVRSIPWKLFDQTENDTGKTVLMATSEIRMPPTIEMY